MLAWNGKPLFDAGKFYNVRFIKYITVDPSLHGSVNLSRYSGVQGDVITAFAVPDQHYTFDSYSITGAELTGSRFTIGNEDINIQGNFVPKVYSVSYYNDGHGTLAGSLTTATANMTGTLTATPNSHYLFGNYAVTGGSINGDRLTVTGDCSAKVYFTAEPKYNITLSQQVGGSISADKTTAYSGEIVNLSNTPSAHYNFMNYSLTGAVLTGSQFRMNNQNVTARANFSAWPVRNVSVQQRTGGTIASNKSTGYDGDVVTLSNTANAGYTFTNYNVTGATLTGNQFAFNGGNVTAQGAFSAWPDVGSNTVRLLYTLGHTPSGSRGTFTQMSENPNIWDYKMKWPNVGLNGQTELLEVIDGDCSNKNMSNAFYGCNKLSAITKLTTTNVTNWYFAFANCSNLKNVYLMDTSQVTSMAYAFAGDISLKKLPLFDTSNVQSMDSMFINCSSLETLPQFNTQNVKEMNYMCHWCSGLKTLPMLNTSALENLYEAFEGCISLSSIPAWNLSNLKDLGSTFDRCRSLNYIPNFNFTKVNNAPYAFAGCWNVSGGITRAYNQLRTTVGNYYGWAFHQCGISSRTGSAELAQIPTGWK